MAARILVLGCGSIGRRHALNASRHGAVGLFDPDGARARGVAGEAGGVAFGSLAEALAWRPDAAIVAVPTSEHVRVARACIEGGIPVLIEKPISHTADGVAAMLERADAAGVPVFVGCNMRFHPGPASLEASLPRIGEPLFLRAHFGNYLPNMRPGRDYRDLYCARRATGGGVVLDSIHEVDYATWLLGPVTSVRCAAGRLSELDIDVEDYAVLTLEHAGGARSEIHLDYLQRVKRRGCEIAGTDGTLVWTSEGKTPERLEVRLHSPGEEQATVLASDDDVDADAPYESMLEAFLAGRRGDEEETGGRLLTGWGGLDGLSVCLAALEVAAEGGERQVPRYGAPSAAHA